MGRGLPAAGVILVAVAGLVAGCQGSGAIDIPEPGTLNQAAWAMSGGTALRQGRTALSGPTTAGDASWQFGLEGEIDYPPALAHDGTIYLAQGDVLSAFSPAGEELWRVDAGSRIVAPPRITSDGLVQVVTFGGTYPNYYPGMTFGSPYVYLNDTGGAVLFVDPAGVVDQRLELPGLHPLLAVGAEDGRLFLIDYSANDFALVGVDAEGTELWRQPLESTSQCRQMVLSGQFIYFRQGSEMRVFQDSGTGYWYSSQLSMDTYNHVAPSADGRLYLVGSVALDDETQDAIRSITPLGYDEWYIPFTPPYTDPGMLVGPGGVLYASDRDDTLYAIDSSGNIRWTYPEAGSVMAIASDGRVYAELNDYTVGTSTVNVISPFGQLVRSIGGFPRLTEDSSAIPDYIPWQRVTLRDDGSFLILSELDQGDDDYPFGLHAVDDQGRVLWSRPSADDTCYGPAVDAAGNVYVGNSSILFALDPLGSLRWSRPLDSRIESPPLLLPDGNILTCDWRHEVRTFAPDGGTAWQVRLGGWGSTGQLAVDASRIYLPCKFTLYCLDQAGNQVYFYNAESNILNGPAVGPGGTAYFIDSRDLCYAIDRSGQELWRITSEDADSWDYPVIMDNGTILFPADGGLVAVDSGGGERWRYMVDAIDVLTRTPALSADGVIYLPVSGYFTAEQEDQEFKLYALRPPADLIWTLALDRPVRPQPLVDGSGNIYVLISQYGDGALKISPDGEILGSYDGEGAGSTGINGGLCIAPGGRLLVGSNHDLNTYGP